MLITKDQGESWQAERKLFCAYHQVWKGKRQEIIFQANQIQSSKEGRFICIFKYINGSTIERTGLNFFFKTATTKNDYLEVLATMQMRVFLENFLIECMDKFSKAV